MSIIVEEILVCPKKQIEEEENVKIYQSDTNTNSDLIKIRNYKIINNEDGSVAKLKIKSILLNPEENIFKDIYFLNRKEVDRREKIFFE